MDDILSWALWVIDGRWSASIVLFVLDCRMWKPLCLLGCEHNLNLLYMVWPFMVYVGMFCV